MPLRSRLCLFICLIAAVNGVAAKPTDPKEFWNTPGETIRDASGRIVYQEVKDPVGFTMRVQENGAWSTYRFHPHTDRIARIDAPDTVEEFQYDRNGKWEGIRIHVNGRKLTFVAPSRDDASIPGLPSLTALRDSAGRQIAWRSGSDTVLSISYEENGIPRIELGPLTLSVSAHNGAPVHTLTGPDGVLATTTVRGRKSKREFRFSLDMVASELGLGQDWSNQVSTKRSSTGRLVTLTNRETGDPLGYLVRHGGSVAAFDARGHALFYDLALDYSPKSVATGGDAMPPDVATRLSGILPSRFVVTARGDVALYVERPQDGAIHSVWIRSRDGNTVYSHRIFQPGIAAPTAEPRSQSSNRVPIAAPRRGRRNPVPNLTAICDVSMVCTSGGCGGCNACSTTIYYCDSGGGGTSGGGSPAGGGSTSGGMASNDVTGDSTLWMRVGQAITSANTKLDKAPCIGMFSTLKDGAGTTLEANLSTKGYSAKEWLNEGISILNGGYDGACSSGTASAYTTIGGTEVYACAGFKNLTTGQGAVRLIHEVLHTLGLQENPPFTSAMSSSEINSMVATNCGN